MKRTTRLGTATYLLPAILVLWPDCARRSDRFSAFDGAHLSGYLLTAVASTCAWAMLLFVATHRSHWRHIAATVFVVAFAVTSFVQDVFFERYRVYLGLDAQIDGTSIPHAIIGTLPLTMELGLYALWWTLFALACIAAPRLGIADKRISNWLGGALLIGALTILGCMPTSYRGVQSSTPDVLYATALRVAVVENVAEVLGGEPRPARFQRRSPRPLPALTPNVERTRNVIVVMQEAVRADMACPTPGEPCEGPMSPSHAVTPNRIQLRHMRSVSSSTAVALATTWSGLPPTSPRAALFAAPLIWDYAHAAGYRTGYWTSQHPMFANTRLLVQGAPRDACVWATQLDPFADYLIGADDEQVTARALADIDRLPEPFFGVVHYSNVHMPRRIDPQRSPFQPADTSFRRVNEPTQQNYYRNAVYLSDLAVADLITGIRDRPIGDRTLIVYLSDHGEAWLEHEQNNDHGSTLFDEEIRVPAWIDAPPGLLSESERHHLASAAERPLFQTAMTPTLLDLLGLWKAPELVPFRRRMSGAPLTRSSSTQLEVLTNVSWAWEYGDPNWAVMSGERKLLALQNDERYRCYDLVRDPREQHDLGPSACPELHAHADEVFGMLPRSLGRLRSRPRWGWPR